jgi:hypothetical protein
MSEAITQGNLFDQSVESTYPVDILDRRSYPLQIQSMWRRYGKNESVTCGNCKHLIAFNYHNKTYRKCDLYAITHGAGTDWRKKWPGCKSFEMMSE